MIEVTREDFANWANNPITRAVREELSARCKRTGKFILLGKIEEEGLAETGAAYKTMMATYRAETKLLETMLSGDEIITSGANEKDD